MNTFKHKFFGWLDADARKWINADGSEGGIVAVEASVHVSARVGDGASVGYGASVGDGDWWITVGPQGSRNTILTAVASKKHGLRWWVGCQHGISTDKFRESIEKTHKNNEHAQDYNALIVFVETHPGLVRWTEKNKEKAVV